MECLSALALSHSLIINLSPSDFFQRCEIPEPNHAYKRSVPGQVSREKSLRDGIEGVARKSALKPKINRYGFHGILSINFVTCSRRSSRDPEASLRNFSSCITTSRRLPTQILKIPPKGRRSKLNHFYLGNPILDCRSNISPLYL